ncbi:MAG: hypothetical protein Aurels2KO_55810 [Aureliella sp.]
MVYGVVFAFYLPRSTGFGIAIDLVLACVLGLPALVNGIESYSAKGTANSLRLITGILGGIGLSLLLATVRNALAG